MRCTHRDAQGKHEREHEDEHEARLVLVARFPYAHRFRIAFCNSWGLTSRTVVDIDQV